MRRTDASAAERRGPQYGPQEHVQEEKGRQRHDQHLQIRAKWHVNAAQLQDPWPTPELFAAEGVAPAAAQSCEHHHESGRGAHVRKQNRQENAGIVRTEVPPICQHVSLDKRLDLAPPRRLAETLDRTAWTHPQKLSPRLQIMPRGGSVSTSQTTREIRDLPPLLSDQVQRRSRGQQRGQTCGRDVCKAAPRGTSLDAHWPP